MKNACFLLFAFAGPLAAQPVIEGADPAIFSLQSGVVCPPETVDTRPAPDTLAGYTNVIDQDPPFVSTVNRVPAVMGIGFGIKAMATEIDGLFPVQMTVTHPAMGTEKITQQTFDTFISGIEPSLTFYQFDYGYELLTGTWTMEASFEGTVLFNASFEVLPPKQVPELASVCGFQDLLS